MFVGVTDAVDEFDVVDAADTAGVAGIEYFADESDYSSNCWSHVGYGMALALNSSASLRCLYYSHGQPNCSCGAVLEHNC